MLRALWFKLRDSGFGVQASGFRLRVSGLGLELVLGSGLGFRVG